MEALLYHVDGLAQAILVQADGDAARAWFPHGVGGEGDAQRAIAGALRRGDRQPGGAAHGGPLEGGGDRHVGLAAMAAQKGSLVEEEQVRVVARHHFQSKVGSVVVQDFGPALVVEDIEGHDGHEVEPGVRLLGGSGEVDFGEAVAVVEGRFVNRLQFVGKADGDEVGAAAEGVGGDFLHEVGDGDVDQARAVLEGAVANGRHGMSIEFDGDGQVRVRSAVPGEGGCAVRTGAVGEFLDMEGDGFPMEKPPIFDGGRPRLCFGNQQVGSERKAFRRPSGRFDIIRKQRGGGDAFLTLENHPSEIVAIVEHLVADDRQGWRENQALKGIAVEEGAVVEFPDRVSIQFRRHFQAGCLAAVAAEPGAAAAIDLVGVVAADRERDQFHGDLAELAIGHLPRPTVRTVVLREIDSIALGFGGHRFLRARCLVGGDESLAVGEEAPRPLIDGRVTREGDLLQARAAAERPGPDGGRPLGEAEARQPRAPLERILPDTGEIPREFDFRQIRASGEGIRADARHAVGKNDGSHRRAAAEGVVIDAQHGQAIGFGGNDDLRTRAIAMANPLVSQHLQNRTAILQFDDVDGKAVAEPHRTHGTEGNVPQICARCRWRFIAEGKRLAGLQFLLLQCHPFRGILQGDRDQAGIGQLHTLVRQRRKRQHGIIQHLNRIGAILVCPALASQGEDGECPAIAAGIQIVQTWPFAENRLEIALLECISPNVLHVSPKGDEGQILAAGEGVLPDAGHAVGDGDFGQMITIIENVASETGQVGGKDDVLKLREFKGRLADFHDGIEDGHDFQSALLEQKRRDFGDAIGKNGLPQVGTLIEWSAPIPSAVIGDEVAFYHDLCQIRAIGKRFPPDAGHAVGNGEFRQPGAAGEGVLADCLHTIAEVNHFQCRIVAEALCSEACH